MFRVSVAILQKPDGSLKTLYVGPDGEAAKAARDNCDELGEVGTLINVRAGNLKSNREALKAAAKPAPEPAPDTKPSKGKK